MNTAMETLNAAGLWFVKYAVPMLIQSSLLTAIILAADLLLRKHVRAIVRYCLWMLVIVKLMLPVTFSSPTGIGYWMEGSFLNPAIHQPAKPQLREPVKTQPLPTDFVAKQSSPNVPAEIPARNVHPRVARYEAPEHSSPSRPSPVSGATTVTATAKAENVRITWQGIVFAVWLAVAGAMLLLLIRRMKFVVVLVRQAQPAGRKLLSMLEDCKRLPHVRLQGRVSVKLSPTVTSPAICGLFRPVIIIPQQLHGRLDDRQLRTVLLHELIHLKRRDLWVNMLQAVLQIVYFYNPLLWLANAFIARVREQAVDEAVLVALGGNADDYPEILLNVAGFSLAKPALHLRLIGVIESRGALAGRIKYILNRPLPRSAKLGLAGFAMLLVTAAVLLPMAKATDAKEPVVEKTPIQKDAGDKTKSETKKATGNKNEKSLDFYVVSKKTGQPIADANLKIKINKKKEMKSRTDSKGHANIKLPNKNPDYFRIKTTKDGFVPMQVTWRSYESRDPVPDTYTLKLPLGTRIGGLVQDESGHPIKGVKVYLLVPGQQSTGAERERAAIWDHIVTTDRQGRWICKVMPPELNDVWIRLVHPEYVSDNTYGSTPKPPMKKLRDMTGVMVLKKGITVTGVVVDESGQPIKGASVAQGSDRWGSHYPRTRTDKQGRFTFMNCKPDEMILTVQAKGYSHDLKSVDVHKGMKPVEFRLATGRTIKGRIINKEGKPISGVSLVGDTWRGHRSIENWRTKTNSKGRFTFRDAPADEVQFDIYKKGYLSVRRFVMTPSKKEYVITMLPPLVVRGSVVDAETGQPIKAFRLTQGIDWGTGRSPTWERDTKTFNDTYDVKFTYPRPGHYIRIEAENYLPAVSRLIKNEEGNVTIDFRLKKGKQIVGKVINAEGVAEEGVKVYLVCEGGYLNIDNGAVRRREQNLVSKTDDKGKFHFPPQVDDYKIVALADDGYAIASRSECEDSNVVKMKKWGKVKGKVRVGGDLAVNTQVHMWMNDTSPEKNEPRIHWNISTSTDKQGRVVLNKVPQGKGQVGRYIRKGNRGWVASGEKITMEPGQTVEVEIGGKGRPVVGQIVVPENLKEKVNWRYAMAHFRTKIDIPKPEIPEEVYGMEMADRKKWFEAWKKTPQGQEYEKKSKEIRNKIKFFNLAVEHDGGFRVEDVPAGVYTLTISAYEPPKSGRCGFGDVIGSVNQEFKVPEMPSGRSDSPLDLGEIKFFAVRRMKKGQLAPEIEFKTLDGKKRRLSQFRGKYVLLDFWATWCGPCVGETPHLKKLYEEFGGDERFVMIGLSLDRDAKTPLKYVRKNDIKWIQGFLGEWSKTKVPSKFGVRGIPAIFLIGPDGKILAKGLRGKTIHTAVAEALSRTAKTP